MIICIIHIIWLIVHLYFILRTVITVTALNLRCTSVICIYWCFTRFILQVRVQYNLFILCLQLLRLLLSLLLLQFFACQDCVQLTQEALGVLVFTRNHTINHLLTEWNILLCKRLTQHTSVALLICQAATIRKAMQRNYIRSSVVMTNLCNNETVTQITLRVFDVVWEVQRLQSNNQLTR